MCPPIATQEQFRAEFPAYRVAFGVGLERWRRRNGWTQDTAMDIGKACSVPHVYGSKWSQLERGVAANPGPTVFYALGVLNECLATGYFLTPGLLPPALREKAQDAEPVRLPDGSPWKGMHFYATFVGNLKWPDLLLANVPTNEEAKILSTELSNRFRKIRDQYSLKISIAISLLTSSEVVGLNADDQVLEKLSAVALGLEEYKAGELAELWDQQRQQYLPEAWLNHLAVCCQNLKK